MVIRIEPGKGNKLYLIADDEYIMTVDTDTWYSLDYSDGCELSDDEFEQLKFIIGSRKAYSQALRFLTLRAHSANELYKKLIKKHSPESSQYAVEKCRELGFVDDNEFAQRYAEELVHNKKYGPGRVRSELFSKGIERELIENVLSSLDFDSRISIIEIIEKKYSSCLDDEKGRRRMIAGLMRLGYSYSDISAALADCNLPEDDYYEL